MFVETNEMTLKAKRNAEARGVSQFIKEQLHAIPQGHGLAMSDLAKEVSEQFFISKQQAYVRVNNAMKGKIGAEFQRFEKSGYTYLAPVATTTEASEGPLTSVDTDTEINLNA